MGEGMGMSMRASFMLGVEYGIRDKSSPRSMDYVTKMAEQALPQLKASLEPVTLAAIANLGLLAKSSQLSRQDITSLAEEFGRVSLASATKCFRVGLEYASRI